MSKVLVTGGAGLIGSHIVDQLLLKGHDVRILDNLEPCTHPEGKPTWIPTDAEFIQGDVRNYDDVSRALKGVEVIFHQAAYGGFAPELTKMTDVNATGTARIFEAIRTQKLDIKKVITASSQAVYGEGAYVCACGNFYPEPRSINQLERGEWEVKCPMCGTDAYGVRIEETAPLRLNGVYAISKYFEERLTLSLGKDWGIPTVALRYSLTYGPRQSLFNPYTGICSIFSTRLLNGLPPVIYEDGKQTRDFVYVEDVARANILVMETDEANGQVYNVGTGRATTVSEFARLLRDAYHWTVAAARVEPTVSGEFRPMDCRHLTASNYKIKQLGWEPETSVLSGVKQYAYWILSKPKPAEYFSAAEKILRENRIVRSVQ